jgi:thiosulfate reductase/polysulfide reductase chain A
LRVRTTCRSCGHGGCGVFVTVEDGRVIGIEGDPDHPISKGYMCSKGDSSIDLLYHPDRLRYPMKRVGERGEGKWQRISWDEALDTIVSKLRQIKEESGAEAFAIFHGTGRDFHHFMNRFANTYGTPNMVSNNHYCYMPRVCMTRVVYTGLPVCDYESKPKCVMEWGANTSITNSDEYRGINLKMTVWPPHGEGAKFIVVDPRGTTDARKADIWLQLRPATDAALGLAMINYIIEHELYNKEFVEKYTYGFKELAERVKKFTIQKAEEITWVPASKIQKATELFATIKPACVQWGVGVQQNLNCVDADRSLLYLVALTGNLDVPGGNVVFENPPIRSFREFNAEEKLPSQNKAKQIGGQEYKLISMINRCAPYLIWRSISEGDPYRIRGLFIDGANILLTRENAQKVHDILKQLEFLVIADIFMTPTAELADILLPVSIWLERNNIADYWKSHGYVFPIVKVVEPLDECWSDMKIYNELAKRLGLEGFWENEEQALNYILEPSGLSWKQFVKEGYLRGQVEYRKYSRDLKTPSGKFELYSKVFEAWGYDPLPDFHEPPESPVNDTGLAEQYPYILITGGRIYEFFHSEHRNIPSLRNRHPNPIVQIHPTTARKVGVSEGQWIFIETPRGRIKQMVSVTPWINPRVVHVEHGWWFPERKEPGFGWFESNANVLTNDGPPLDPRSGATNLRGLLCNIYRA